MIINPIEKRKEPRIPVELEGYLKKIKNNELKKCNIKNLSLHGALISLNEPLKTNEHVLVQIKSNGTSSETTGIVKWCRNGSLPYNIGLYLYEPVNIRLPLKEISSALKKAGNIANIEKYFFEQSSLNTYLDLIKDSTSQLHVGYICFFLKNKIMNLFQTINTEINLIDLAVKKILKTNYSSETSNKDISNFYHQHFFNLNIELNKVESFLKILDKEIRERKNHKIAIIHLDKIINSIIHNYYQHIDPFKEIEFISNFSNNIKPFIGNKYILKKAIEMIFTFHINYILFYNANRIKVYLTYIESKKRMLLKIINNGSKMFNDNIEINKKKLITNNYNNNFLNYLKFIALILEEYEPYIKILSESGNNHFILSVSIDPVI